MARGGGTHRGGNPFSSNGAGGDLSEALEYIAQLEKNANAAVAGKV